MADAPFYFTVRDVERPEARLCKFVRTSSR